MPKAGLFAGEVTTAAPADGAITTKNKGYQWMEYGNVTPIFEPHSGGGYALTQSGFYGTPDFAHPYRNQTFNELTMSTVFRKTVQLPTDSQEDKNLFRIMQGAGTGMTVRFQPITSDFYVRAEISTKYPSESNAIEIVDQTYDIGGSAGWGYFHWYWMAMSYDSVSGDIDFWMRNLTLGEEVNIGATLTNQRPVMWDGQTSSDSIVSYNCGGRTPTDTIFDGAGSQTFIHNKYIDLSDVNNRNKFCCSTGIKDVGTFGELPFGEQPLVYLPYGPGLPLENLGTLHIGDFEDFYQILENERDENLPPECE